MPLPCTAKVRKQMNREGIVMAHCQAKSHMHRVGLQGVPRGKVTCTTISDAEAPCPMDRLNRIFKVERPNQLWVSDFSYVST
jgi:putative transposase